MSSISAMDIQSEGWKNLFIVGDVFMQEFYTVFDRDYNKIELA